MAHRAAVWHDGQRNQNGEQPEVLAGTSRAGAADPGGRRPIGRELDRADRDTAAAVVRDQLVLQPTASRLPGCGAGGYVGGGRAV